MIWIVVCAVALAASALTLYSGFGLGTLLLPAFALFFEIEVAVAATAAVHLANNLFKLFLVGRHAQAGMVALFGVPALFGAAAGAWVLSSLSASPIVLRYQALGAERTVAAQDLAVAVLMLVFAVIEWLPPDALPIPRRWVPAGGLLSGFCGGVSGHQGALRSAVLLQAGLDKRAFIGTGVACAVLIDVARLAVYGATFLREPLAGRGGADGWPLVGAATVAAFAGAWLGVRFLEKVTLAGVRRLVATMLVLIALLLGTGWI